MNCRNCSATTTNGLALCERCRRTLRIALVNIPAYETDVLRIQPGERVRVRSAFASAPPRDLEAAAYDPISDAAQAVDNAVSTWCRALADDRPDAGQPPADTQRQCAWLERHTTTIATLEWAGECLRDMVVCERKLRRLLDQADTGWYAGKCGAVLEAERIHSGQTCGCSCHQGEPCDLAEWCDPSEPIIPAVACERGIYATPGSSWITCPECGASYNVADRRDVLLREARDELAPIRTIAKVLVGLLDSEASEERLAKRLDKWTERGRLSDMGVRVLKGSRRPVRVYRVGDVWDTLVREQREVARGA